MIISNHQCEIWDLWLRPKLCLYPSRACVSAAAGLSPLHPGMVLLHQKDIAPPQQQGSVLLLILQDACAEHVQIMLQPHRATSNGTWRKVPEPGLEPATARIRGRRPVHWASSAVEEGFWAILCIKNMLSWPAEFQHMHHMSSGRSLEHRRSLQVLALYPQSVVHAMNSDPGVA